MPSAMTLDSCHARMPPPESTFRRQNSWLGSKSAGDSQLKGQASKLAKDARRRRLELRRIRSFSQVVTVSDPPDSSPIDVDVDMQKEPIEGTSMDLEVEGRRRSHGKISVVGRRREMDDAVAVKLGFLKRAGESYDFFGVFGGREWRRGPRACSQMLPPTLAEIVDEQSDKEEIDWEEVMIEGFQLVEAKMHENSAAAAAVVGDNEVVVAGWNSKAVLCRGGMAVRLLDDGKGKGGERGVQVGVAKRSRADEFLILGSDGFWGVISDEVACQIAGRYCGGSTHVEDRRSGGAEAAAALMAEVAVAHGSKDNVSIIVVDLRGAADDERDDGN